MDVANIFSHEVNDGMIPNYGVFCWWVLKIYPDLCVSLKCFILTWSYHDRVGCVPWYDNIPAVGSEQWASSLKCETLGKLQGSFSIPCHRLGHMDVSDLSNWVNTCWGDTLDPDPLSKLMDLSNYFFHRKGTNSPETLLRIQVWPKDSLICGISKALLLEVDWILSLTVSKV